MFAARAALMTAGKAALPTPSTLLHFNSNMTNSGTSSATWGTNGSYGAGKFSTNAGLSLNSLQYAKSDAAITLTNNFTVECWFNPSNLTQTAGIISTEVVSSFPNFALFQVGATIQWTIANSTQNGWSAVTSAGTVVSGWNHLAMSCNSSTINGYLNGTNVFTLARPSWTSTRTMWIGSYGSTGYGYAGAIDEFVFDTTTRYSANFTLPTAEYT